MTLLKAYYYLRPFIPRSIQIFLRRIVIQRQRLLYSHVWPIDPNADRPPVEWPGWPDGKQFALVLTHDIDTARGQENCLELMRLEKALGFRSSFNFVPDRYRVSLKVMSELRSNGFEIGVHGLYHDGKLYQSRKIFQDRVVRINQYLNEWGAVGFRSPAMHRNLDWIHDLNIKYDSSSFDTDPFEPQPHGVGTIFPFCMRDKSGREGYVELPCTLPQDFTLFVLMKEKSIEIWRRKLDWIVEKGGMALLNTHPDYMNIGGEKCGSEEYQVDLYVQLLEYIKNRYQGTYWHVLPKDVANFWAQSWVQSKS